MITGWADEKRNPRRSNGGDADAILDWNGRRVVVVGLARSGQAAVELLLTRGARVTATDTRSAEELALPTEAWLSRGARLVLGGHPPGILHGAEIMVVSPGVPSDAPIVADAVERGIPVVGELELAYRISRGTWLAVTGTNGKTTTTALLGSLVERTGKPTIVAGNIGVAASSEVAGVPENGYVVAEVSSFQLDTIQSFRPKVAVLLNITEDHLDRYESFHAYAESKRRIFENQTSDDYAVLNVDDALVSKLAGVVDSAVIPVSAEREVAGGVFVRDGSIVSQVGDEESVIMSVDRLGIRGPHNLANAQAALAAALAIGVEVDQAAEALEAFRPLRHRMEPVARIGGVSYVNDSKATNVESVMRALESYEGPVVLIAGGREKGADFVSLAELVEKKVRSLILMGEAAPKLEKELGSLVPSQTVSSMDEAVHAAARSASSGDVVLLSPACASFDMFRDFEDRGDRFRDAVLAMVAEERGSPKQGCRAGTGQGEEA